MDGQICLVNLHFDQQKSTNLNSADLSKKGSVDEPIVDLVTAINSSLDFFTTSSCSGRAMLYSYGDSSEKTKKSDCRWHFTTHHPIEDFSQFSTAIQQVAQENPGSPLVLKFEPFILHVQCRSVARAKALHTCALDCGYRNSGTTLGKGGKATVAVRGTLSLEVPLGRAGELMVSQEYLTYLVMQVVKEKFEKNAEGIARFEKEVKSIL